MRTSARIGVAVTALSLSLTTAGVAGARTTSGTDGDAPGLSAAVDQLSNDFLRLETGLAQQGRTLPADGIVGSPRAVGCTQGAMLQMGKTYNDIMSPKEQTGATILSSIAFAYADEIAKPGPGERFGTDGEHTAQADDTMRRLQGFWDIDGAKVSLVPAHGTDLANPAKMGKLFSLVDNPQMATLDVRHVRAVLDKIPELEGGRSPVLTLNAYSTAQPANRITLGDGIITLADKLGFSRVDVPEILAHEYGHQNQFANHYKPTQLPAAEMGADAFSGYFLASAKGMRYDATERAQAARLAWANGDCEDNHGTPNQRAAALRWGEQQYDDQPNPDTVMPTATFIDRWRAAFSRLHPGKSRDT